ncbi:bifunctional alpha/beta hydrolase/OsmC family protein [Antarcticibacterium sp. 1MA-6-2]|uniref:bifunctional alpha/beta hydrolase/OsmC family protein n=1 Tax=Antarcticibacterium sp. 1MA-6-2 TaxID=2908210 RepID=UPI001F175264|nr:bifunctional alpha/beta hydrolase/OsmC family protein [Antarcticibacterium sp. 1MA-6-2]UJH92010.1 bifunctional alpha/beta hydrolase/OsmC family protein [Antarcticibacterium sp. 1MA-6-2]
MNSSKIFFENKNGDKLAGYLEMPFNTQAHNFVLFAHCFTCNKNFKAVKNICSGLTSKGFGVLRFDFTGLGESEGEFANSNFSGNIEDLLAAADYLKENYKTPTLLVGHSLGGAAVLFAAQHLSNVKAVATIGTPASIKHVTHLLQDEIEEINSKGMASVNIGGRPFSIKKQFLNDLDEKKLSSILPELNKSLLILHSPQDTIVEVKNAEELYRISRHPKSFVSLDGADHLLSKKEDSLYVGQLIGSWAYRYLEIPEVPQPKSEHEVVAHLGSEGFTTYVKTRNHQLIVDEPESAGGSNYGPSPYDLLSAALASCTSMTIQMYARRKNWKLETVETHVNHSKSHSVDCEECEKPSAKIDLFEREIIVQGELDEKQKQRILQIADKCPVHKTLHEKVEIKTKLKDL